jgi:hypothetical protein
LIPKNRQSKTLRFSMTYFLISSILLYWANATLRGKRQLAKILNGVKIANNILSI